MFDYTSLINDEVTTTVLRLLQLSNSVTSDPLLLPQRINLLPNRPCTVKSSSLNNSNNSSNRTRTRFLSTRSFKRNTPQEDSSSRQTTSLPISTSSSLLLPTSPLQSDQSQKEELQQEPLKVLDHLPRLLRLSRSPVERGIWQRLRLSL